MFKSLVLENANQNHSGRHFTLIFPTSLLPPGLLCLTWTNSPEVGRGSELPQESIGECQGMVRGDTGGRLHPNSHPRQSQQGEVLAGKSYVHYGQNMPFASIRVPGPSSTEKEPSASLNMSLRTFACVVPPAQKARSPCLSTYLPS